MYTVQNINIPNMPSFTLVFLSGNLIRTKAEADAYRAWLAIGNEPEEI